MPLKKSELYTSLWKSGDELRGGTRRIAIMNLAIRGIESKA